MESEVAYATRTQYLEAVRAQVRDRLTPAPAEEAPANGKATDAQWAQFAEDLGLTPEELAVAREMEG